MKPLIPPALRREVKRRISPRYRYFDRDRHRPPVGRVEEWEEHGNSQFDYLVEHGLRPHHYLLDERYRVVYFDRDSYHYDLETFEWICRGTTLRVRYLAGRDNPRHEKMLVFMSEP